VSNDWLDIETLEDYLDGKLDARAMHRIEKEALEDPFVAEALEGLSRSPKRSLQSLSMLQKQLHDRIALQHTVKKESVVTWQRLSIAATAAVLFVSVSVMFWMREANSRLAASRKEIKKVEVVIAPDSEKDAIPAGISLVGAEKYEAYLSKNNKLASSVKTGKYTLLSFTIDGQGKAQSIRVMKSAGMNNDQEAIRLLVNGPEWIQSPDAQRRFSLRVPF